MEDHKLNKEFQNLVTNPDFINWVNSPTTELDKYWEQYILDHPSLKNEIFQAKYILKKIRIEEKELNTAFVQGIWLNIQSKVFHSPVKVRRINNWLVAASITFLLAVGGIIFSQIIQNQKSVIDYQAISKVESDDGNVTLILSDKSERLIQSEDPSVTYIGQGEILIDSLMLSDNNKNKETDNEKMVNQLVIPKGKRSSLILADGTKVYLNSGSRVIYPVNFSKKEREIYIEGEAYLEVAHNEEWPFYVVTNHMKVRVLGTTFNVKSYADEATTSVILVEGSVQAIVKSKKILMQESELLTLSNESNKTTLEKVSVLEYVSWKDGWMHCNNETIESIAIKLARYYNVDIRFANPEIKELTISGKLDLKTECSQVFDVLSFTAPVKFEENNGIIIVSFK
jgi:hypothetical protein